MEYINEAGYWIGNLFCKAPNLLRDMGFDVGTCTPNPVVGYAIVVILVVFVFEQFAIVSKD